MKFSKRIEDISPYFFSNIVPLCSSLNDIINLASGDPDLPPPYEVIEELKKALLEKDFHKYPPYLGIMRLKEKISEWMSRRFNVELDPEREVITMRGTKNAILQLLLALCDKGDYVIVPNPYYPTYRVSVKFVGAFSVDVPLDCKNDFLPDLEVLKPSILRKTKAMILNYPNNPTGKRAEKEFFSEIVNFCSKWGIILIHDNPYSEVFENSPPPSILEVDGAKNIAVELHSFSKTYNMQGFRIGWVCGNRKILQALSVIKTNTEIGVFYPIQRAAIKALEIYDKFVPKMRHLYKKRRRLLKDFLDMTDCYYLDADSTLYVWTKINYEINKSTDFIINLLKKYGVWITPGVIFGKYGEGFVRFSITQPEGKIKEGMRKFIKYLKEQQRN